MTSYGKEKPVCTEPAEPCWVRNRRDHFSLK
jgi:outer membrane protein OmpA-like peptidoglycan-associated protein